MDPIEGLASPWSATAESELRTQSLRSVRLSHGVKDSKRSKCVVSRVLELVGPQLRQCPVRRRNRLRFDQPLAQDYCHSGLDPYSLAITQPTNDGCEVNRLAEPDPELSPQRPTVGFEAKPHFHDVGRLDDVSQELMRTGNANLNNEGVLQGGKRTTNEFTRWVQKL